MRNKGLANKAHRAQLAIIGIDVCKKETGKGVILSYSGEGKGKL
jgi:hypothetical protein